MMEEDLTVLTPSLLIVTYLGGQIAMCTQQVDTSERQILPTNVKPVHYDLTLQPDLETFVFQGHAKIE
jgi:hypothetical protein